MWAKYEEIQKFTTVNRFSKITDISSLKSGGEDAEGDAREYPHFFSGGSNHCL